MPRTMWAGGRSSRTLRNAVTVTAGSGRKSGVCAGSGCGAAQAAPAKRVREAVSRAATVRPCLLAGGGWCRVSCFINKSLVYDAGDLSILRDRKFGKPPVGFNRPWLTGRRTGGGPGEIVCHTERV